MIIMLRNTYTSYKCINRSLLSSLLLKSNHITLKTYTNTTNTTNTTTTTTPNNNKKKENVKINENINNKTMKNRNIEKKNNENENFNTINELNIKPDINTINKMISKCSKANDKKGVMEYFNQLESYNLIPNHYSFENIILMYIQSNDMVLSLISLSLISLLLSSLISLLS